MISSITGAMDEDNGLSLCNIDATVLKGVAKASSMYLHGVVEWFLEPFSWYDFSGSGCSESYRISSEFLNPSHCLLENEIC